MQLQPLNDCEVAFTLSNAHLSFPGGGVVGSEVLFSKVFLLLLFSTTFSIFSVLIFGQKEFQPPPVIWCAKIFQWMRTLKLSI